MLSSQFYPFIIISFAYLLAVILAYRIFRVTQRYLRKSSMFRNTSVYKLSELKREVNQLCGEFERGKALKEDLKKKLDRYSALKEMTELLSSSLHLRDVVHFVVEETFKIVGKSERMLLFVIDEKRQELALIGSKKLDTDSKVKSKKGDVFDKWILENRRPLIISDIVRDYRFLAHKKKAPRPFESLISVPMMLENRILGILRLETLGRNSYTADDLRILCVISDISAVAINNAYLYAKTEELAIKDGLTGLYVQRYFKERLKEEAKRADRKEYKFSLLMLDIDHFKYYNDKYGHAAGDIVLRHIAGSLQKFADTGDIIARYGGEEFAVILAKEDKRGAARIAEEMRRHIAKDAVMLRGSETHVTASVGIATYPSDAANSEDLIRTADANLYKAKKEGRDQICF